MEGCQGKDELLRIQEALVKHWLQSGILRCIRDMVTDPAMALLAVARVAEINWSAQPRQKWFLYNNEESFIVLIPVVAPVGHRQALGTVAEEGGHDKNWPVYYEDRGKTRE